MQTRQVFKIALDLNTRDPLFEQISEQVKQAVAKKVLRPGDRLPTVRRLAQTLVINPGTVARAYLKLEQEKIVVSHRGGGTKIVAQSDDPAISKGRWNYLSNLVNTQILEVLSLGYTPQELEAIFSINLSRWREERREEKTTVETGRHIARKRVKSIVIEASNDLALDLLVNKLRITAPEIKVELNHTGSLGGLIALQKGKADIAGIHLLDAETGEYNYPYLKHLLPGRELAVIHLACRIQGLIIARNNPKQIKGFDDLRRNGIIFINRQKGSGTRVLLDLELRKLGVESSDVMGYKQEVDTHLAVAMAVSRGEADVGLGIQAAANSDSLDFIPLLKERYDLVIPIEKYKSNSIGELMKIISSKDFEEVIANIGGYDTSETGSISFSSRIS
jgi:molybdate-binding protein/DNA-binding transcriptional regulator YhcF (GntR family)